MISVDSNVPAIEVFVEMSHGKFYSQQFSLEGGVFLLTWIQHLGPHSKRPPVTIHKLIQHSSQASLGRISRQSQRSVWTREVQHDCSRQQVFGSLERLGKFRV